MPTNISSRAVVINRLYLRPDKLISYIPRCRTDISSNISGGRAPILLSLTLDSDTGGVTRHGSDLHTHQCRGPLVDIYSR